MKQIYFVSTLESAREIFVLIYNMVRDFLRMMDPELEGVRITIEAVRRTRSLEQNNAMWAMLSDIARQQEWIVDGLLTKLAPEEWKDILSAALTQEMRVAQGVNGGVVLLGRRTSKMTISQMSDLIEIMMSFGSEKGIRWTASEKHLPDYHLGTQQGLPEPEVSV